MEMSVKEREIPQEETTEICTCADCRCETDESVDFDEEDIFYSSVDDCMDYDYCDYPIYTPNYTEGNKSYITHLRSTAAYLGFDEAAVDSLLSKGYSVDEIEQYLYDIDGVLRRAKKAEKI